MSTINLKTIAGFVFLAAAIIATPWAGAQQRDLQTLRGTVPLDETNQAPEAAKLETGKRFERAYRQQPPLIPHAIEKYQINVKVNQCLRCHDWPYNVQENAPKVSETHYVNREGVALDRISSNRWFCTQCHVPQASASALVPNTFRSATGQK